MRFAHDSNGNTVPVRDGDPIGGVFVPGATLAVDTWHRLMPHGSATHVDIEKDELDIGALRADILGANLSNWQLHILNDGYQAHYRVKKYDAPSEILTADTINYESVNFSNLPTTVSWVIRPHMIQPFTLHNRDSSTNAVEIGYSPNNISSSVIELAILPAGTSLLIPVSNIHKLFFRYAAIVAADVLEWGEHSYEKIS